MRTISLRWLPLVAVAIIGAFALAWMASNVVEPPVAGASISKGDKDCDDFRTQKKAQKFFKKHNPSSDPHYLDADNDGIACEDNPCPCASRVALPSERVSAARRF